LLTAGIGQVLGGDDDTSTVVKGVSLVAVLTDANILVEQFALRVNFAANAIHVEVVVNRASNTGGSIPLCTSEVIIK
jgi:hypothetical protein